MKEGRALSPFFHTHTPVSPKSKNTLQHFLRIVLQVFLFHMDWDLTVAMVTDNGQQNSLK